MHHRSPNDLRQWRLPHSRNFPISACHTTLTPTQLSFNFSLSQSLIPRAQPLRTNSHVPSQDLHIRLLHTPRIKQQNIQTPFSRVNHRPHIQPTETHRPLRRGSHNIHRRAPATTPLCLRPRLHTMAILGGHPRLAAPESLRRRRARARRIRREFPVLR